jgi:hypothetical protein
MQLPLELAIWKRVKAKLDLDVKETLTKVNTKKYKNSIKG